jgi:hypothetical protein
MNRTIQHWNQLPADVLEALPCKQITFKNEGKESDNWGELKEGKECWKSSKSVEKRTKGKWKSSNMSWSEMKWSEVKWNK